MKAARSEHRMLLWRIAKRKGPARVGNSIHIFAQMASDQDAAARRLRECREHLRHRHYRRAARRVVTRTVVDRVSAVIRLTDAHVIVVRSVDDEFVGQFEIGSGDQAEGVGVDLVGERLSRINAYLAA